MRYNPSQTQCKAKVPSYIAGIQPEPPTRLTTPPLLVYAFLVILIIIIRAIVMVIEI